jgi:hypothetical protein
MIKDTDLRKGNKVKQSFATLTVLEIYAHDCLCTDWNNTSKCTYKNLQPIIITPEILLSYGFKHFEGDAYILGHIKYFFNQLPKGATGHSVMVQYKSSTIPPIYTLHELQNAVYYLTGHELEIKTLIT